MHSELWTGDESGSQPYSTEEPCQTRRAVLVPPTFWPGSQPCSLLHCLGQGFSTWVFAVKSVPGSPARVQPETHPCHSCTCISLRGGAHPCPAAWPGAASAAGQPLVVGQGAGSPRQCCLELAPCGGLAMRLQAGSYLARHRCAVIPRTFPSACLSRCISRHGICPPVLLKHPRSAEQGKSFGMTGG